MNTYFPFGRNRLTLLISIMIFRLYAVYTLISNTLIPERRVVLLYFAPASYLVGPFYIRSTGESELLSSPVVRTTPISTPVDGGRDRSGFLEVSISSLGNGTFVPVPPLQRGPLGVFDTASFERAKILWMPEGFRKSLTVLRVA